MPKPVRIQLYGDSTMWGYDGGSTLRAPAYPELVLQQEMDRHFGAGAVTVTTRAVSGTLTTHLLEGTDRLNKPWPASVDAELVVLNFGINDWVLGNSAETYKANLRLLAVAPAKVVFQTPLPIWAERSGPPYSTVYAAEMLQVATELKIPVADASRFALSIPTWNNQFAPDGVHPNSAGYVAIVTRVLAPTLLPLVTAARCR